MLELREGRGIGTAMHKGLVVADLLQQVAAGFPVRRMIRFARAQVARPDRDVEPPSRHNAAARLRARKAKRRRSRKLAHLHPDGSCHAACCNRAPRLPGRLPVTVQ